MVLDKRLIISGALAIAVLVGAAGATALNALQVRAATDTTTTPAAQSQTAPQQDKNFDPAKGGHIGSDGTKEKLLTGDTAEKVKAAALAAVSGGTVQRVETDAEGSPYEAHMTKSDGTRVTVKVDANFKVTTIEDGPSRHK